MNSKKIDRLYLMNQDFVFVFTKSKFHTLLFQSSENVFENRNLDIKS